MINFRKAILADIPQIREIAYSVWPVAYGEILSQQQLTYMLEMFYAPAALTDQMKKMGHYFIVAEDDASGNRIVGFASFSPEEERGVFHLHKLYVLHSCQGHGIGRRLIRYVIGEIVDKKNAAALRLNVNRHNTAIRFYTEMGFRIISREDNDIGSGFFMNDYVMEKILAG